VVALRIRRTRSARLEDAVRGEALTRTAVLGTVLVCGCAGARVTLRADSARYPVSLSGVVRDATGRIHDGSSLTKVGSFRARRTSVGFAYSALTTPTTYDISDAVNLQVATSCGEAIVNLSVSVSDACAVLNFFPFLDALPFWPGCAPVSVVGDIVRQPEAGSACRAE
jgi:hypothetical protein